MVKTASNIVVGAPSTALIGAYGAAEGASVDIGSTEGGLKVMYTPEFYFKKADQWTGKVGAVKTNEDMTIEVIMSEATLANLAYAFGYPTGAVAGTTLDIGGNATVTERTMYINGNAPGGGSMKITVHKCVPIEAVEMAMLKDDKTVIKLTLQVLQDTSKAANKQFIQVDYSSTDTTPPTVAMTSPIEDGTVVGGAKTVVQVTFTEADNKIDEGTLIYGDADNATVFINDVEDPADTSLVAGTISYNSGTKVLTFTPTSNWAAAGQNYQLIITTGVRDTAGNHMAATFYGHFVSA